MRKFLSRVFMGLGRCIVWHHLVLFFMLRPTAAAEVAPLMRRAESQAIVIGCTGLQSNPIRRRISWARNTRKRGVWCKLVAAHIVHQTKRIPNTSREVSRSLGCVPAAGRRLQFVSTISRGRKRPTFERELAVAVLGCIPAILDRHQLVSAYPNEVSFVVAPSMSPPPV